VTSAGSSTSFDPSSKFRAIVSVIVGGKDGKCFNITCTFYTFWATRMADVLI
jgi:hypothetical protein